MTIRVLIVDDERPARAKIRRLLADDARFAIVGEASDGFQALDRVETLAPDLVFLDIQMPGIDGFEMLAALGAEREFVVVLSTAHDEHALRAFDAHALDYLLKPYDKERFRIALEKACRLLAAGERQREVPNGDQRRVVRSDSGWIAVDLETVIRAAADDKQVILFTTTGALRVRHSLTDLTRRLDPERFVRVHRGEIVRVAAVARYEPSAHGDGVLTLTDGSAVVLSRTRREAFVRSFRGQ
jgi:two-component system LytT family response regulator